MKKILLMSLVVVCVVSAYGDESVEEETSNSSLKAFLLKGFRADPENQYRGFYVGLGISGGKKGIHCDSGRGEKKVQGTLLVHHLASGDSIRLYSPNLVAGGSYMAGLDAALAATDFHNSTGFRIALADGNPFAANHFLNNNQAYFRANSFHTYIIRNVTTNGGVDIYMDYEDTYSEEDPLDASKIKCGVSLLAGYGRVLWKNIYLGAEFMQCIASDTKNNRGVKLLGCVPSVALRAGFIHHGWLAYVKFGGAYSRVKGVTSCGKLSPLIGGGVERTFGERFSVRVDADYIAGAQHDVGTVLDKFTRINSKTGAAPGPIPQGVTLPGLPGLSGLPLAVPLQPAVALDSIEKSTHMKRKGNFNVRLFVVYHI
jgi:hypothetical protein